MKSPLLSPGLRDRQRAETREQILRSVGRQLEAGPLEDLGAQDVTCEVCVDQLAEVAAPASDRSQADWLRAHGLDELVAEGRAIWQERAAIGDLAAVRARSRVNEGGA